MYFIPSLYLGLSIIMSCKNIHDGWYLFNKCWTSLCLVFNPLQFHCIILHIYWCILVKKEDYIYFLIFVFFFYSSPTAPSISSSLGLCSFLYCFSFHISSLGDILTCFLFSSFSLSSCISFEVLLFLKLFTLSKSFEIITLLVLLLTFSSLNINFLKYYLQF